MPEEVFIKCMALLVSAGICMAASFCLAVASMMAAAPRLDLLLGAVAAYAVGESLFLFGRRTRKKAGIFFDGEPRT